jgi:starch synthase
VVVDGETGLLVAIDQVTDGTGTPVDPEAFVADLAAALTDAVSNPDRAKAWGVAARHRVEEHFSWDAIAERTLAVYQSALGWEDGVNPH